jgi:hypothetical protein
MSLKAMRRGAAPPASRHPAVLPLRDAVPLFDMHVNENHLYPRQQISIDHFIYLTKGRLISLYGQTKDNDLFSGGCIFIDHTSQFIDVQFQAHLNTHETLMALGEYELMCQDYGVGPQSLLSH